LEGSILEKSKSEKTKDGTRSFSMVPALGQHHKSILVSISNPAFRFIETRPFDYMQVVLHPVEGFESSLSLIVSFTQPDNARGASFAYIVHKTYLIVLLTRIALIDAGGIDP
jgi:hypothetical protein